MTIVMRDSGHYRVDRLPVADIKVQCVWRKNGTSAVKDGLRCNAISVKVSVSSICFRELYVEPDKATLTWYGHDASTIGMYHARLPNVGCCASADCAHEQQ